MVELLIVVSLVGILSVGALTVMNPFVQAQKARDAKRKAEMGQIQRALEAFYNDNGSYPQNDASYQIKKADNITSVTWGSAWSPYMIILPKDPSSPRKYLYVAPTPVAGGNPQAYYLYTSLERGQSDPQACNNGNACSNVPTPNIWCGPSSSYTCNYGVTSPNVVP